MTLKEIIENEMGENYMELVRSGTIISEYVIDGGWVQCGCCDGWENACDMEISSGMTEYDDICADCYKNKPNNKYVKQAILSARNNGYDDV